MEFEHPSANLTNAKNWGESVTADTTDHDVFILGAGFSRDAGAPLIHDFLDMAREFLDDPKSDLDLEERTQFRVVFDFRKRLAQAREKFRIDLDNIEQLFGLVEMSHRLEGNLSSTRDGIVYLIAKTLQLAVGRSQHRGAIRVGVKDEFRNIELPFVRFVTPEYGSTNVYGTDLYQHFALLVAGLYDDPKRRESRSNTIITFNYDLVLDDALRAIGAKPEYGLRAAATDEHEPEAAQAGIPVISVLKLHGSTNWAICPRCKTVHILGRKVTEDPVSFRSQRCASCSSEGLRLLLVPPSWDKSEHNEPLQPVWRKAVDALKSATRICVIGYSMPESDAFFKFLLTLGMAENHQLYRFILVDKVGPEIPEFRRETLKPRNSVTPINERYQQMLEDIFVERRFVFEPGGLYQFLRGQAAAALGRAEVITQM